MRAPKIQFETRFKGAKVSFGFFSNEDSFIREVTSSLRDIVPMLRTCFLTQAKKQGCIMNPLTHIRVFVCKRSFAQKVPEMHPSDGRSFDAYRVFGVAMYGRERMVGLALDDGLKFRSAETKAWLAYVLAHELGHALFDLPDGSGLGNLVGETMADFIERRPELGLEVCRIAVVMAPRD